MAYHDSLTGLPNRRLLRDRFELALARARRKGEPLAVISVDLDKFKLINDTFGHLAGDQLLKTVAERLTAATRETDTVARIGGDEFLLVLPEADSTGAALIAGRVLDSMTAPVSFDGQRIRAAVSLGVSIYPEDGHAADTLIKAADSAMYAAKREEHPLPRPSRPALEPTPPAPAGRAPLSRKAS
jgi:diguanylate cyclase (GGDEF)-like protein